MKKKSSKVKGHVRVVVGAPPIPVREHVRVSFSGDGSKSNRLRPSVFGIGSPSEAEQAARIIASFEQAMDKHRGRK